MRKRCEPSCFCAAKFSRPINNVFYAQQKTITAWLLSKFAKDWISRVGRKSTFVALEYARKFDVETYHTLLLSQVGLWGQPASRQKMTLAAKRNQRQEQTVIIASPYA